MNTAQKGKNLQNFMISLKPQDQLWLVQNPLLDVALEVVHSSGLFWQLWFKFDVFLLEAAKDEKKPRHL